MTSKVTKPEFYVQRLNKKQAAEGKEQFTIQSCAPLGSEDGGNTIARLFKLTLESHANDETAITRKVMLKIVDTSHIQFSTALRSQATERFLMWLFGYTDGRMLQTEVLFYATLKPFFDAKTGHISMFPDVYIAEYFRDKSLFSVTRMILFKRQQRSTGEIIMEDLSTNEGQFFSATSTRIDIKILQTIAATAAKFSALSIAIMKDKASFKFPYGLSAGYPLTIMNIGILSTIKRSGFGQGTTKRVRQLWGGSYLKYLEDDLELVTALEALEKSYPQLCKISQDIDFKCLLHGDLHAQNAAYFPGTNTIKFFDMQLCGTGSPAIELVYFIASNLESDDREGETSIIQTYHSTFVSISGITTYPIEKFILHIRLAQIEYAVATLVRRSKFETPQALEKLLRKGKKFEAHIQSLQKLLVERERRWLEKIKMIWLTNPTFQMEKLQQI